MSTSVGKCAFLHLQIVYIVLSIVVCTSVPAAQRAHSQLVACSLNSGSGLNSNSWKKKCTLECRLEAQKISTDAWNPDRKPCLTIPLLCLSVCLSIHSSFPPCVHPYPHNPDESMGNATIKNELSIRQCGATLAWFTLLTWHLHHHHHHNHCPTRHHKWRQVEAGGPCRIIGWG